MNYVYVLALIVLHGHGYCAHAHICDHTYLHACIVILSYSALSAFHTIYTAKGDGYYNNFQ